MKRQIVKKERRQYPRVKHALPLNIAVDGYDFITSTHDLSCIGAYCHVEKYIPPFTRIMVRLTLPTAGEKGNPDSSIEFKGVVVRTVDEDKNGFNIAIFFNEIRDSQREKIAQYISQFLPK